MLKLLPLFQIAPSYTNLFVTILSITLHCLVAGNKMLKVHDATYCVEYVKTNLYVNLAVKENKQIFALVFLINTECKNDNSPASKITSFSPPSHFCSCVPLCVSSVASMSLPIKSSETSFTSFVSFTSQKNCTEICIL